MLMMLSIKQPLFSLDMLLFLASCECENYSARCTVVQVYSILASGTYHSVEAPRS